MTNHNTLSQESLHSLLIDPSPISSITRSTKKTDKLSKQQIQKHILQKIRQSQGTNLNHKTAFAKKKFRAYMREKQHTEMNCQFQCSVCLEMIVSPSPTPCGHIFCFKCIEEALLHKSVCPICRAHIRSSEFTISKSYQRINKFFWTQNEDPSYQKRQDENLQWEKERFLKLDEFQEGEEIDVCDTEHIWCKAMIKKVFKENGKQNEILVHYGQWNKIYDEVINVKSQRLAPYGFFSDRTDIPHYRLSQNEDNLRGRIGYGRERERTATYMDSFFAPMPQLEFSFNFSPSLNFQRIAPLQRSIPFNRPVEQPSLLYDSQASVEDQSQSPERDSPLSAPFELSIQSEYRSSSVQESVRNVLDEWLNASRELESSIEVLQNPQNSEQHFYTANLEQNSQNPPSDQQ